MKGKTEMTEETINIEATEGCPACLTVPVSHLSIEEGIEVPLGGWQGVFDQMGIKVVTDPAGREAITTLAARRLLASIKRQAELTAEARARGSARLAAKRPMLAGGVPAREGMSPLESLLAAGPIVTPEQEFGLGRPKPRFLEEELAEGERALTEKKRLAAERAKGRLSKEMQDQLGGKP